MRKAAAPIVLLALLTPLVAGCHLLREPDMSRTSSIALLRKPRHPLIVIPGFLGTKLRNTQTDKVVWGRMTNVLMGGDSENLALSIDGRDLDAPGEQVEPYAIYDSLWGIEYYRKILGTLRSAGGYRIGDIDDPRPGDNAYVFVYDWRRDNVDSARRLAEAIDRLKERLGDPDLRFDLLAHSQGGLIARYYVKYGGAPLPEGDAEPRPTMAGAANIHKVILLGTPNRGCVEALKILHEGVEKIFRPIRPEVVFTMPSVYQMLPPRGSMIFADRLGRPIPLDLYDPDTWEDEGWSAFEPHAQKRLERRIRRDAVKADDMQDLNERYRTFLARTLRRADRFHRALDAAVPASEDVAYHAFGSDCQPTLKTALLIEKKGGRIPIFDRDALRDEDVPETIADILFGAGDGTVLMESLLGLEAREYADPIAGEEGVSLDSAFFVCENHGVLPNNPIFQNNLFYVLLREGEARNQGVADVMTREPVDEWRPAAHTAGQE